VKVSWGLRIGEEDVPILRPPRIDYGTRGLGLGYVADITLEVPADGALDFVGKPARVGYNVEGVGQVFEGVITRVRTRQGKAEVVISHPINLKNKMNLLKLVSGEEKHVVAYGARGRLMNTYVISREADLSFVCSVGSKSPYSYCWTCSPFWHNYIVETVISDSRLKIWLFRKILGRADPDKVWYPDLRMEQVGPLYSDGDTIVFTNPAGSGEILSVGRRLSDGQVVGKVRVYGLKKDATGTLLEVELSDRLVPSSYDSVKLVYDSTVDAIWGVPPLYVYYTGQAPTYIPAIVTPGGPSAPVDILTDILQSVEVSEAPFLDIELSFQSEESYEEIVQRVAKLGLIYVFPLLNRWRIAPAVTALPPIPKYKFTDREILQGSMEIEKEFPSPKSLQVLYSNLDVYPPLGEGSTEVSVGGLGDTLVYDARWAGKISALKSARAYVKYIQALRISFETPLIPDLVNVDVGDFVRVGTKDFQVIARMVHEDKIRWELREAVWIPV